MAHTAPARLEESNLRTHTHTHAHTHTLTHANTPRPVRVAEVWWLDKTEGLRDVKILVLGPYNMQGQTFAKG